MHLRLVEVSFRPSLAVIPLGFGAPKATAYHSSVIVNGHAGGLRMWGCQIDQGPKAKSQKASELFVKMLRSSSSVMAELHLLAT